MEESKDMLNCLGGVGAEVGFLNALYGLFETLYFGTITYVLYWTRMPLC